MAAAPKKKRRATPRTGSKALSEMDKAACLVHMVFHGKKAAAAEFDISTRTLRRYHQQLDDDEKLSEAVQYRLRQVADADGWAASATQTIRDALAYIRVFCESPPTADGVLAITNAMAVLMEADFSAKLLEVAINETAKPAGSKAASDAADTTPAAAWGRKNVHPSA